MYLVLSLFCLTFIPRFLSYFLSSYSNNTILDLGTGHLMGHTFVMKETKKKRQDIHTQNIILSD